jgi:cytochrome bd-type quinol oxidase subunit 2
VNNTEDLGRHISRSSRAWVLLLVGFVDALVICLGLISANHWLGSDAFTAAGICASALITFLGLVYYLISVKGDESAEAFRHSIAATFMLVYLVLVTISAFPDQSSDSTATDASSLPPITGTLLTNFTTLAGIIAAFYFGGTIIESVAGSRHEARADDSNSQQAGSSEVASSGAGDPSKLS